MNKYLLIIIIFFASNCRQTDKNSPKEVMHYIFGTKSDLYLLKVYDSPFTPKLALAKKVPIDKNNIQLYDKENDALISIVAGKEWPFDDFTYPEKCHPDGVVSKTDYLGRKFCLSNEFSTYSALHLSDSLKIHVAFNFPSYTPDRIMDSLLTGYLNNISISPHTSSKNIIEGQGSYFEIPKLSKCENNFRGKYWSTSKKISYPAIFQGIFRFNQKVDLCSNIKKSDFWTDDYYAQGKHDGFQIFDDFSTNIAIWIDSLNEGRFYYPIFIVNETYHILELPIYNDGVMISQEVKKYANVRNLFIKWVSIEPLPKKYKGNILVIPPSSYALFLLPKYLGNYNTGIRARVFIGDNIYLGPYHETSVNGKLLGN